MKKQKFNIEGMHCSSCAMNIDGELEDLKGVAESRTSYAKMVTEVSYDDSVVTEAEILQTISKIGYTATTS